MRTLTTSYNFPPNDHGGRCLYKRSYMRGFALIATISVMVLLVMIALAMLSLSTIESRSSRQGDAMAEARANARLSLMFAIGELQKEAGPDQTATASGAITSASAQHKHIAGVWQSWRPDPFSPPSNYDSTKEGKFRRWIISHGDPTVTEQPDFAENGVLGDSVELLGEGTLGNSASADDYVRAGKISVASGKKLGTLAWVAMDEGVKARINMPLVEQTGTLAERSANLGSASRVGFEKVESKYNPDSSQTEKMVTLDSASLELAKSMSERVHDLTVWSMGPMTNVVDGGLRDDLNLLCDRAALPSEFANNRIYSGNATGLNDSDPYWQQIFEYGSLYKTVTAQGGLPQVAAKVPAGYQPVTGGFANKTPPNGMALMPSIAKVQVVFSLLARRAHGGWGNSIRNITGDTQRHYMVHMIFSPIVTLHNPYNVALKFDRMRLDFNNVPMGFKFYRNGQPQNSGISSLNNLYVWQDRNMNASKKFGMTIMNAGSSGSPDPGTPIVMQPGEVKVFSPYLPPGFSWNTDRPTDGGTYFDWRNNDLTSTIQAIPGWRGEGIGYDIDWLTPRGTLTAQDDAMGVLSMRWTDTVQVEYAPHAPPIAQNRFTINSILYTGRTATPAGIVEFDYKSGNDLTQALPAPSNKPYLFPSAGEPAIRCGDIYEANNTPIASYEKSKAFAVFSAYAKTTNGGKARGAGDEDHMDGRHFTKAWSFTNPTSNVSSADLVAGHGSHSSHELNLEQLPGAADDWVQVDGEGRGNFITGHTAFNGLKFGTHNELPIAPIQSLANLQNANLASSGYLPKFDYPLANSFAHPLLKSGSVRQTGANGDPMLDHSYMLNHTLYDRFYCSTVADYRGGLFGSSGRATQKVFEDFMSGEKPLLDPRFVPYRSNGKSVTDAVTEVVGTSAGSNGYKTVAAYQMLRGEWNVNSVSVDAWKAVLAGLHHTTFPVYDAIQKTIRIKRYAQSPMSRFRLPNALNEVSSGTADMAKQARWAGFRELQDSELTSLAEEIVKQVRERGPFLSLSEFVNRRLSGSQKQQLAGALQAAVDATTINNDVKVDGREITRADINDYKFDNPLAATGSSTQGAPGSITQGHILNALGNAVTVRSNTFKVRAYGESVDSTGRVLARTWCEAVVQRVPDYMDGTDEAHVKTADLTSVVNRKFGRRFRIISFRWLGDEEV